MMPEEKIIIGIVKRKPGSTNKEILEAAEAEIENNKTSSPIRMKKTKFNQVLTKLEGISRLEKRKTKYFLYNMSKKKIKAYDELLLKIQDWEKAILKLTNNPKKVEEGFCMINELLDLHRKFTWMYIFIESEVNYHEKQQMKNVIKRIEDLIKYVDFTVGRKYPDLDRIHIQDVKAVLELRKRVSKKLGVPIETVFNPEYFCTRFMSASAYNALK